MITPEQAHDLAARAYVPEHLPPYVTSISKSEPFLLNDFLVYFRGGTLIFIGYPLSGKIEEDRIADALLQAKQQFKPSLISITTPLMPKAQSKTEAAEAVPDWYYRLDLLNVTIDKKLRNLLKRARRDLHVERGTVLRREHQHLIKEFIRTKKLEPATRSIFQHLADYIRTGTALLYEARTLQKELTAFTIADLSAEKYSFYLFNFCSRRRYVPGAADLLLQTLLDDSRDRGKRYLNLGLGINPGVEFFKTKWGAERFLPHHSLLEHAGEEDVVESLLDSLF